MIVLADTSVWIEFFRRGHEPLATRLAAGEVLMHPVVVGELATGNLSARARTLTYLLQLPRARSGSFEECLRFLERNKIYDRGLGWNDAQILYSCHQFRLVCWTLDRKLHRAASELSVPCLGLETP